MKKFTKEMLEELYLNQKLNPYQIGEQLECDHKTVRSYLKKHNITMRTAQEYNYLPRQTHISPTIDKLNTKVSIMAHTMYICEGWHTDQTSTLVFTNQDVSLINIFVECLEDIYEYGNIVYEIAYNKECNKSHDKALQYADLFSGKKVRYASDPSRKNPIVKIKAGGKNMAREFIANAYKLLNE